MASCVNRGCAARSCSTVSPAANFSRMSSTVIRVPVMTGLPIIIEGSAWISSSCIVFYLACEYSTPNINIIGMGLGRDIAPRDHQRGQFACGTRKLIDTPETGRDSLTLRRTVTKLGEDFVHRRMVYPFG